MQTKITTLVCLLFISSLYGQEQKLKYFNISYTNSGLTLSLKSPQKISEHSKGTEVYFIEEEKVGHILDEARDACFIPPYDKKEIKGIMGVFTINKNGEISDVRYHIRPGTISFIPEEELFKFYTKIGKVNWLNYLKPLNGEKDFNYTTFAYILIR